MSQFTAMNRQFSLFCFLGGGTSKEQWLCSQNNDNEAMARVHTRYAQTLRWFTHKFTNESPVNGSVIEDYQAGKADSLWGNGSFPERHLYPQSVNHAKFKVRLSQDSQWKWTLNQISSKIHGATTPLAAQFFRSEIVHTECEDLWITPKQIIALNMKEIITF